MTLNQKAAKLLSQVEATGLPPQVALADILAALRQLADARELRFNDAVRRSKQEYEESLWGDAVFITSF